MRCLFPDLTTDLAAVVSTHGYYEIQSRDTFTGYASWLTLRDNDPVSGFLSDLCPGLALRPEPTVVRSGPVSDLGLVYDPAHDDIDSHDYEVIRGRLLELLAADEEA